MSFDYAARLSLRLKQTVSWKSKTGQDKMNEPTYDTTSISARKEAMRKMVRDLRGEEVVSNSLIITQSAVQEEDMIDGEKVISVEPMVDGEGNIIGYEVYV